MWLRKQDMGIRDVFSDDAVYVESWGPEYHGAAKIKLWFDEWNTRGSVCRWDIRRYFHDGDWTAVEWYFEDAMNDGKAEAFEGMSLIQWTGDGKICFLKEFGCNESRYDPYQNGKTPQFRGEKVMWF